MAEATHLHSRPHFPSPPDPSSAASTASKKAPQEPSAPTSKAPKDSPASKRKLSKSRNGCITCKAKRLKCDETKPSCNQCARRSVHCGGYKKDFKWRSFEEASFARIASSKPKKSASSQSAAPPPLHLSTTPPTSDICSTFDSDAFTAGPLSPTASPVFYHELGSTSPVLDTDHVCPPGMRMAPPPPSYIHSGIPTSPAEAFTPMSMEGLHGSFEAESAGTAPSQMTAPSSVSSGQSPLLMDLLLSGTNLSDLPSKYLSQRTHHSDRLRGPAGITPPADGPEDDIEEIPRDFSSDCIAQVLSPCPSSSSISSSGSDRLVLLRQLQFSSTSPEILTRRFHQDTCGVLSVKDGPTENPWRTLVWPLAHDCPALYYAIASMTFFHQSKDSRVMRYHGIEHMRTSMHALRSSLERNSISLDAAISTTLALGFSDSWDQHIRTGLHHIRGARTLIDAALVQHRQNPKRGIELDRLRFLCNTWVYMSVIARLTSADDDDTNDFDSVFDVLYEDSQATTPLDPLMGCAGTLFPIIGRVANLARRARRSESNSITMISEAADLKKQLDDWCPPNIIEDIEDDSTSSDDLQRTATAYKYATLLYLHQTVPEIPSLPASALAEKALRALASVRLSSGSVIISIFPLMAAGCEATSKEDRHWVSNRWDLLSKRMKLGILEKCQEVTKEVWNRRDAYAEAQKERLPGYLDNRNEGDILVSPTASVMRGMGSALDVGDAGLSWPVGGFNPQTLDIKSDSSHSGPNAVERIDGKRRASEETSEELGFEYTVRGRLHWLSVMKEWRWEILLG